MFKNRTCQKKKEIQKNTKFEWGAKSGGKIQKVRSEIH